jgi:hypothetical protein
MALAKEDVEQIQAIVLQTINNTPEFKNANVRYEIDFLLSRLKTCAPVLE